MAKQILTERMVQSALPESGRRAELWDARTPGLCLRVTDRGVRTWIFRYRAADGKQPRFTIGNAAAISLKEARARALEIDRDVASGRDPASERRAERIEVRKKPRTFSDLADDYFSACASGEWKPKGKRKRDTVIDGERDRLRLHVLPVIGGLPFTEVTRQEVKTLLRGMIAKGIGAQTNLTQAIIRQVYNYAIGEDLVLVNPATGFAPFAYQTPRSRIWSDAELRVLWSALQDPGRLRDRDGNRVYVSEPLRLAIALLIMLGQRRAEVIGMGRAELDLSARTWLIAGKRMKGGKAHMVPLPPAAVPLIKRAIMLADMDREQPSAFVFPNNRVVDTAMAPNAVTHAMARLKSGMKLEGPTVHDLRRTVSTNLTSERCGITPFIRSKVLGHIDGGGGALVSSIHYDSNTYIAEKRRALETWSDVLSAIVSDGADPSLNHRQRLAETSWLHTGPR